MHKITTVCLLLFLAAILQAKVIRVPQDFATVQEAIDFAANGDTVLVGPGSYFEAIDFLGKAITVKSTDGPDVTTGLHPYFDKGEGPDSVLEGFGAIRVVCEGASPTIRNNQISMNWMQPGMNGGGMHLSAGASPIVEGNRIFLNSISVGWGIDVSGAGVYVATGCHPVFRDNIIDNNSAAGLLYYGSAFGGAIYCESGSSLTLENNLIEKNYAEHGGDGVVCSAGSVIIGNTFRFNDGQALYCGRDSLVAGNLIHKNNGVGLSCQSGTVVVNNTIVNNEDHGIYMHCKQPYDPVVITNCIIWNNWMEEIRVIYGVAEVTYSDVQEDWPGIGNIKVYPAFRDESNHDFHLMADSPCIDVGDNGASGLPEIELDLDGDPRIADGDDDGSAVVDMGVDEFFVRLKADAESLSEAVGGDVNFVLNAGPVHAGRTYLLLGSVSGTVPGTSLPGNQAVLPLNLDFFTSAVFLYLNTPLFHDFLGVLDASGTAAAQLASNGPLPTGSAGHVMYFAYCLNNPFNYVSDAVLVKIVP